VSWRSVIFCLALLSTADAHGLEADLRLKWFSTASLLPTHDVQRVDTPLYDHSADMRLMLKHKAGDVRLLLDHSTVLLSGDGVALQQGLDVALDQTVVDDSRRWVDLTWDIEDGNRHRSFHRLDRLAMQWQPGD